MKGSDARPPSLSHVRVDKAWWGHHTVGSTGFGVSNKSTPSYNCPFPWWLQYLLHSLLALYPCGFPILQSTWPFLNPIYQFSVRMSSGPFLVSKNHLYPHTFLMSLAAAFPSEHTWPHILLLSAFLPKLLPCFLECLKHTLLFPLRFISAVGPAGIISQFPRASPTHLSSVSPYTSSPNDWHFLVLPEHTSQPPWEVLNHLRWRTTLMGACLLSLIIVQCVAHNRQWIFVQLMRDSHKLPCTTGKETGTWTMLPSRMLLYTEPVWKVPSCLRLNLTLAGNYYDGLEREQYIKININNLTDCELVRRLVFS